MTQLHAPLYTTPLFVHLYLSSGSSISLYQHLTTSTCQTEAKVTLQVHKVTASSTVTVYRKSSSPSSLALQPTYITITRAVNQADPGPVHLPTCSSLPWLTVTPASAQYTMPRPQPSLQLQQALTTHIPTPTQLPNTATISPPTTPLCP